MTAEEAAEAARRIQPALAVPMHWGEHIGTKDDADVAFADSDARAEISDNGGRVV